MIDLHMHTVFSDGASEPEALIQAILEQGVQAIAVTDHDNMDSLERVQQAAAGTGLEVIPGIEINTAWKGQEVHILGYFIDPEDSALQEVMDKHRHARVEQMHALANKLQAAGIRITLDDIRAFSSSDGTLGRPHVARALVEKGVVKTISEAFNKYLNSKAPTYVRRNTVTPHEAVEAIYESGGIPVIAHPGDMIGIENLTEDLMNYGLRGLEAYHRSHSPALIEFHSTLAEHYGLIVTGGTDFHGTPDAYAKALSHVHMPAFVYEELKKERQRLQLSSFKAS